MIFKVRNYYIENLKINSDLQNYAITSRLIEGYKSTLIFADSINKMLQITTVKADVRNENLSSLFPLSAKLSIHVVVKPLSLNI